MATTQQQLTAQQFALYLGQEALTDVGIGTIDTISLHNTVLIVFEGCDEDEAYDFPCDEVKPILRRFDSLTLEEKNNEVWNDIDRIDVPFMVESFFKCSAKPFAYLLSLGIDLFGWIDAGLAIDKATLYETSPQIHP